MSWGSAIVEAIDRAHVMLLLFSSHANASPQIKREVERAVHKEVVIVPVRVENVNPTGDFEYFLGTPHWLDAITPPFEQHLNRIADSAKYWLDRIASGGANFDVPRPPQPARDEPNEAAAALTHRVRTRPKWIVTSIVALVIALVGTATFFGVRYYAAQQEVERERAAERVRAVESAREAAKQHEQDAARAQGAEDEARKREAAEKAQKERAAAEALAHAKKAADAEALRKRSAPEEEADIGLAPSPAVTAPPPLSRPYNIVIEAVMDKSGADEMVSRLKTLGYKAQEMTTTLNGQTWYRVQVGPYGSAEEATAAQSKLREQYKQAYDTTAP